MKFRDRQRRIGRFVARELWRRRRPHGLVGARYLFPGSDPRIRAHRRLWWSTPTRLPRPLWLIAEAWLWLRWVLFFAWGAAWTALRRFGPEVAEEGVSRWQQGRLLLSLAIGWCIHPEEAYRYRLFHHPEAALDYVYEQETAAYHRWRDGATAANPASRRRLGDKWRLSRSLRAVGIPVVDTLQRVARGEPGRLAEWAAGETGALFCKGDTGSRGRGAFMARFGTNGLEGRMLNGARLPNASAVERAWRRLVEDDDALIQPMLENHPALAPVVAAGAGGEDVVVLRIVTERRGRTTRLLFAMLEVPLAPDANRRLPHTLVAPVELSDGRPKPFRRRWPFTAESLARKARHSLAELLPLPHWDEIVHWSLAAHDHLADPPSIAWDWVVTPQGPRLLEGNGNWELGPLQRVRGGLLHAEAGAPGALST